MGRATRLHVPWATKQVQIEMPKELALLPIVPHDKVLHILVPNRGLRSHVNVSSIPGLLFGNTLKSQTKQMAQKLSCVIQDRCQGEIVRYGHATQSKILGDQLLVIV